MESRMVFASVFQDMENFHLVKEDGMIAYIMQESYGYKALNVLSSSRDYPYKNGFYASIQTPMIDEPLNAGEISKKVRRSIWIIKNAKKIDVLNLWFANRWTYFNIFFYCILNKHGLVYVHCDTTDKILTIRESTNPIIIAIKHVMLRKSILKRVLWGVQGKSAAKKLKRWPFINVKHIPNGYWWTNNNKEIKYDEKENIILFVGRIGTFPKNNEVLIEAFCKIADKHPTWTLRLVGTVEPSFEKYMEGIYTEKPSIQERIVFVGSIEDRETLRNEYAKAKIFAMTSRWEGFSIVKVEALSQGCYFVSTDIPSSRDILDYAVSFGELFPVGDSKALSTILDKNMADESKMEAQCPFVQEFAREHFLYTSALRPLHEWICEQKENYL